MVKIGEVSTSRFVDYEAIGKFVHSQWEFISVDECYEFCVRKLRNVPVAAGPTIISLWVLGKVLRHEKERRK